MKSMLHKVMMGLLLSSLLYAPISLSAEDQQEPITISVFFNNLLIEGFNLVQSFLSVELEREPPKTNIEAPEESESKIPVENEIGGYPDPYG